MEPANHGGLQLTPASRAVLSGQQPVLMRRDSEARPLRTRQEQRTGLSVLPADLPLFNALRGLRRELAQEQGVPAYVILHDSTLRSIAEQRPTSVAELGRVGGIGGSKLNRYGQRIIELILEQG